MFQAVTRARLPKKQIKYAGMAELADALDSGNDTLVKGYLDLVAPSSKSCFV